MKAPADIGEPEAGRRERADARRNRARIIEAAREVFASQGLSCQIDEIARTACVGTGTIYRNFPTKQALLEAIVVDGVQQHIERARALAEAADPAAAFFQFMSEMIDKSRANKGFYETLAASGIDYHAVKASASGELQEAVEQLLTRAKEAGGVRADARTPDVMAMLAGTCQAAARSEADSSWLTRVFCAGLRPE